MLSNGVANYFTFICGHDFNWIGVNFSALNFVLCCRHAQFHSANFYFWNPRQILLKLRIFLLFCAHNWIGREKTEKKVLVPNHSNFSQSWQYFLRVNQSITQWWHGTQRVYWGWMMLLSGVDYALVVVHLITNLIMISMINVKICSTRSQPLKKKAFGESWSWYILYDLKPS